MSKIKQKEIERKARNKEIIIWVILALIVTTVISIRAYRNRGWEEESICEFWQFYDDESMENGYKCIRTECVEINTKENTRVEECKCIINNKPVRYICLTRRDIRHYNWETPLNEARRGELEIEWQNRQ